MLMLVLVPMPMPMLMQNANADADARDHALPCSPLLFRHRPAPNVYIYHSICPHPYPPTDLSDHNAYHSPSITDYQLWPRERKAPSKQSKCRKCNIASQAALQVNEPRGPPTHPRARNLCCNPMFLDQEQHMRSFAFFEGLWLISRGGAVAANLQGAEKPTRFSFLLPPFPELPFTDSSSSL
jgi:hypothetical protein